MAATKAKTTKTCKHTEQAKGYKVKSFVPMSQDEKNERLENAKAMLAMGVGAIQDSDDFKAMLRYVARFHRYSWNNTILMMVQKMARKDGHDLTRVANFNTWIKQGRKPIAGKGLMVLVPYTIKTKELDVNGNQKTITLFTAKIGVWDISDTEAIPGREVPEVPVTLKVNGEADPALFAALVNAAESQGITVSQEPSTRGEGGWYRRSDNRINVTPGGSVATMIRTLAHELGHANDPDLNLPAGVRETVADGVAYVLCHLYGIDTGDSSFAYIATWAGNKDGQALLSQAGAKIARIVKALSEHVDACLGVDVPEDVMA